jgi:mannose-6-phosphate isomerase-like protein (cupin superfamily)
VKIRDLNQLPDQAVSHNPAVKKRVLLRCGELGPLTQLARSSFPPGETVSEHSHADMAEVFLVIRGEGTITVDEALHPLRSGVCVVVEPGEQHTLTNSGSEPLVITTIGLRV